MRRRTALLLLLWLPTVGAESARPVTTAQVQDIAITPTVRAWGSVQPDPDRLLTLALPRAAVIGRVHVRSGQTVAADAPLLDFATSPTVRQDHAQAASALDYARRNLARAERLFAWQLATRADLDAARRDLKDAQSRLAALAAVGAGARGDTLRAPVAGIVTQIALAPGARVAADTVALTLAPQQALVAALGVEPDAAMRIAPGASATVRSVFGAAREFTGRVTAVQAMADPITHLIGVLVSIPEDVAGYPIGAAVQCDIALPAQTALRVPRAALLADGGGTYLFVVRQRQARRVQVQTGAPAGDTIVVQGALQAGERVVTIGGRELGDGDPVTEPGS